MIELSSQVLDLPDVVSVCGCFIVIILFRRNFPLFVVNASEKSAPASSGGYDYDLVIIGAGVGGHGAALHAVDKVGHCV